jgi:hypothetical protein
LHFLPLSSQKIFIVSFLRKVKHLIDISVKLRFFWYPLQKCQRIFFNSYEGQCYFFFGG